MNILLGFDQIINVGLFATLAGLSLVGLGITAAINIFSQSLSKSPLTEYLKSYIDRLLT